MLVTSLRTLDHLLSLQKEFEGVMKKNYLSGTTASGVYPPINLFHRGEDLTMVAELPGFQKENILIEIKKNLVRVAGERAPIQESKASAHRLERKPLKFDRTIKLPFMVNDEDVHAEYTHGLLIVRLSRAEEDKPRQISIN